MTAEKVRLDQAARREKHWRRWGPYLAERAWGTVREDYSPDGEAWQYLTFDDARSKAYRWGEDGINGWCDNHQRLCFALSLWNGRDPILKERLFGLAGPEGNHGEDCKELYYYLDSTPTHSYVKLLYKYPQAEFPYRLLREESRRRTRLQPEFELLDTGVFADGRYFDVFTEYAKAGVNDILIRITVANRGPQAAQLHLLPTLWFRNTWCWNRSEARPMLQRCNDSEVAIRHASLGQYRFTWQGTPELLFTENETNTERLYGHPSPSGLYKDGIDDRVLHGREGAVSRLGQGTKCAGWYRLDLAAGQEQVIDLRLTRADAAARPLPSADDTFALRRREADEFYECLVHPDLTADGRLVQRQAFAGLMCGKQWYHFVIDQWLKGDPAPPKPPACRQQGRNREWDHLFNEDILSMPDKWEYPWFAAWDTAFHMIPYAVADPDYAKSQLLLFLREWYMHPNGQIPAYEWNFSDVNPPVHAWACWRVYKIDQKLQGRPDHAFLERAFHKLMLNFTWWVNRKDSGGNNIFEGGFLGLDNIGVFDRSKPLPTGGYLEQSDGTSWMAMYCLNMLKIAMELALVDPVYEDVASKFFEHFLYIANAMNHLGDGGLWDEEDGFYYDRLRRPNDAPLHMKVRSMVGLIPLFAVDTLDSDAVDRLPGFKKRMTWFLENRPDLVRNLAPLSPRGDRRLLSIVYEERLRRVLQKMLDESEFLSPYGVRSLSKFHERHPYRLNVDGALHTVNYEPGESLTPLFGGNSNWRGPVWFPVNYLMIEALQKLCYYFGDACRVEFPTGSGQLMNLSEVAAELSRRLSRLFLRDESGRRAAFGASEVMQNDPHFRDHVLFYEYFHGDDGSGLGASHQTGWTGLVAKLLQQSGE